MELNAYNLADIKLLEDCRALATKGNYDPEGEWHRLAFIPLARSVVLGAGNTIAQSVKVEACEADGVSVIKRPSGGEAVLVSPRTMCYSCCLLAAKLPRSADYFSENLEHIITTLSGMGVEGTERRGISDLCIGEFKFLGCAIYRSTNLILFQAVINLAEPAEVIARYLLPPLRMPEYRANRPHEAFVRSLAEQGYSLDTQLLQARLEG